MLVVLLLVGSAVSVLAAEPPPSEDPQVPPLSLQAQADLLPDAADVREGIEMVKSEETARERELEGPMASGEREESLDAFADLDVVETQQLLQATFAEELAQLNADPARSLGDAEIVRTIGTTVATVTEDGDGALLDAGIPVRTEDEEGDLRKVDLSLEATATGFETANALSDVSVGDTAVDPVEVGDEGVSISQVGTAEDSDSRRFGDQNVFQFETLADTDTLISPTASGVEIFNLLRSEESPETFRFEIELPLGAELRPDGRGGAAVTREGETIAAIPFPTAVDAQGTEVPVDLAIEGDTIALHVAHRDGDYAMPILLDPILEDWVNASQSWHNGYNLPALTNGAWQWVSEPYGAIGLGTGNPCYYTCWGRGLYITSANGNYGANVYSHWVYAAPNLSSYIAKAQLSPFWRDNHNCSKSQYGQPHDYDGLWDQYYGWRLLNTNKANDVGNDTLEAPSAWGHSVIVGMHTGAGVNIPCWRDVYVGGAAVWLDDWASPQVSASVSGVPSSWFNGTQQITVGASSSDAGLGVRLVTLATDGKGVIGQDKVGFCTGLYGNRCPTTRSSQFNLTGASFAEGIRGSSVSAEDPTGKPATGGSFQTKVDYSPPEVTLDGQLAEATEDDEGAAQGDKKTETLPLPVYNLKVEAKDGSNASNETRRSGVKNIEVFLDDVKQSVPWSSQGATEDSRPMTQAYQLKLSTVTSSGVHKLKVLVRDQVDNVRERVLEFEYFPATGMKDEYVMQHFPLPDGKDHSEEEVSSGPELAVNVMNGNLVYHEQDVDVEGAAVDLEVERYYNSQLPEAEDTEWGDGWTLAQTPELDPVKVGGSPVPNEAEILESSGAIEGGVGLPTAAGSAKFDPEVRATLTKKQSGGYELTDETGESATSVAFDATGQAEALLTDGYAKVDYDYEGGHLTEIAVEDPGATSLSPEEVAPPTEGSEGEPEPSYVGRAAIGLPEMFDIAIGWDGNTWVLDRKYASVVSFDAATGEYLSFFGSEGTQLGDFKSPSGLAIDSDGLVWVADTGNNRIQLLSPNGSPLGVVGSYGSGQGQFNQPADVAVDDENNVWVADAYNCRIQKFSRWGEFLGSFGSPGTGDGKFLIPKALDVGPEGDVWVADTYNDRVQKLTPDGEHLFTSEASIPDPEGIVVDADGEAWVSSASSHAIWHLGPDGEELGQFGSYGIGEDLRLNSPHGLTVDSQDQLFVADTANTRAVRWALPPSPEHLVVAMDSFGAQGAGEGEMSSPMAIDSGPDGDIWVADSGNSRIQHFDSTGEPLGAVGVEGGGSGQLYYPMGVATGPEGDVWVADTYNYRVQHFDAEGNHLGGFGTWGEGPGEFSCLVAVDTGPEGDVWTLDSCNDRVQRFDAEGNYLGQFGQYGSEKGRFISPSGLAIAPGGSVWVADAGSMRVQEFSPGGKYRRSLDLGGEEPMPTGVEVDEEGNVWVAEGYGERILGFTASGRPLGQFSSGSSEYELSLPYDVATVPGGDVLAVGSASHSIQRFHAIELPASSPNFELPADDPSVEVETSGGLISTLEGEEAGEHSYEHAGDFLTSHDGPDGETLYEKNAAGLLSKVTLPNGTWGQVEYFADNRVKSVTVKPAEAATAKTTTFEYQDSPQRRTVVDPPDAPYVTYEIGVDGSVFQWSNAAQPPTFDFLGGTLWDHREEENGLWPGDHVLDVQAFSAEGIASIQIIANGNQLVHETTCAQDPEVQGIECVEPPLKSEWVASTDALAPGHLQIEVIATDHAGGSASKRFWVDIPEPPPPPAPGGPIPPKFADILRFREEHGLEVVFPVANEIERNERIFNLIKAWYEGEPVARASWERWGVPLRPQDVAELEWRIAYSAQASATIPGWVAANASATFAGFYVDERAGGILRIGFTGDQAQVDTLRIGASLSAPASRVTGFPSVPLHSLAALESLQSQTSALAAESQPSSITDVRIDVQANKVRVGASNVAQATSQLHGAFGVNAPAFVAHQPTARQLMAGRERIEGPMRAGDLMRLLDRLDVKEPLVGSVCTGAFGAFEHAKSPTGQSIERLFALTAGHCMLRDHEVIRRAAPSQVQKQWIGVVRREGLDPGSPATDVDAAAIRLKNPDIVPRRIFTQENLSRIPVTSVGVAPQIGTYVCYSGITSNRERCGPVVAPPSPRIDPENGAFTVEVCIGEDIEGGDSGAPAWIQGTGAAVGIMVTGVEGEPIACFEPLKPYPGWSPDSAVFTNRDMAPLNLVAEP